MAPCERPEAEEVEEEEMDPDYAFFLNHLHPRGTSYVLQYDDNPPSHHPIRINYEEAVDDDDDNDSPLPSINRNNNNYTKKKKKRKKEREEAEDDYFRSEVLEVAADTSSSMDKHYGYFLRHLRRMPDGSIVLELDNGVVVPYEKEKEETREQQQQEEEEVEDSVSENEGPTQVSHRSSTGPDANHRAPEYSSNNKSPRRPPSRYYSSECSAEYSPFKKKLMKALERPFNQREYDELMKLANACKPVVKFKHLRTDDIPYESETMGLSYFDYYPELARKVKHADRFRGLNLLRGFFFWLKNLELEGSYRPWVSKRSRSRTIPSCSYESLA